MLFEANDEAHAPTPTPTSPTRLPLLAGDAGDEVAGEIARETRADTTGAKLVDRVAALEAVVAAQQETIAALVELTRRLEQQQSQSSKPALAREPPTTTVATASSTATATATTPAPTTLSNILTVNVGGTLFTTRRSTLCRVAGSFLESMFSGRFSEECDERGAVFIDRNPRYFGAILHWLRDPLAPLEAVQDAGFMHELAYYGLKEAFVGPNCPRLFAFGGDDLKGSELKAVECLQFDTRTWTPMADLPVALALAGCAALGSKVYVTGGRAGSEVFRAVYVLDTETDTWRVKAPMKVERHGHACAFVDNLLFATGGSHRDLDGTIQRFRSVERYEPLSNTWTDVAPMNTARSLHVAVVFQGCLWVIGGKSQTGQRLDSVEVYDPSRNTWTMKPPISQASMSLGTAVVKGQLLVMSTTLDPGSRLERFDVEREMWVTLPPPPVAIWVPRCAVVKDRMVVLVGNDTLDCAHSVFYEYDPDSSTWSIHSAPLLTPRNCYDVAVVS